MEEVIRTELISKRYKDVLAVSELSLNVRKGEIYGFLGLNGAGKTTTIRMLLGMINPSSGTAFINGKKVHSRNTEFWKEIGYLFEMKTAFIMWLTLDAQIYRRFHNVIIPSQNGTTQIAN